MVTQIFTLKSDYETQGVTENISQGGAYVKVEDWRVFQTGDQTVITIILPPSFTDGRKTIGLRGEAEVTRTIHIEAPSATDLLVKFLNEIIYMEEVDQFLPREVEDISIQPEQLGATLSGTTYDPSRHAMKACIKAATYHGATIQDDGGVVRVRVIFDI